MKKITSTSVLIFFFAATVSIAQKKATLFNRVEPPNWWVGMNASNSKLQILCYNQNINISNYQVSTSYPDVSIIGVEKTGNPHYLFLNVSIGAATKAGKVPITFTEGKKTMVYDYYLKEKSVEKNRVQGFYPSDVMYLIMPDRFANGDPTNDTIPGMFQGTHRDQPFGRHGGDLKGIADHLDYIKDLGVTAIWLNPVLENNQKRESYHGYAVTDLYNVDRRLGGNDAYMNYINKSHSLGLKVIQDMVLNHIGNEHWLMKDLPSKDWVHQFPTYTSSNYRTGLVSDPYQSQADANLMSNGWFDTTMPDVNQQNPLFAKYLIQNSLWWIEHAGIDGIRMDTYPYPDKAFMTEWAKAILDEYPSFNIVGEAWINSVAGTAYWQKDARNADGYNSRLPSVTDFPFCFSVPQALNEEGGWDSGLARLYNLLSQDAAYTNANNNLTFLDNHDLTRIYLLLGRDLNKMKMALAFLMTTRGIPQLYYGIELLMDGDAGSHPNVRKDYPGGWGGDSINAFKGEGLTAHQKEFMDYMKKLLKWRSTQDVIHSGKLKHFVPKDNVYVYVRYNDQKTVMVILNGNTTPKNIELKRFAEAIKNNTTGVNCLTGEQLTNLHEITLSPHSATIIELR
jgi:glycosidase